MPAPRMRPKRLSGKMQEFSQTNPGTVLVHEVKNIRTYECSMLESRVSFNNGDSPIARKSLSHLRYAERLAVKKANELRLDTLHGSLRATFCDKRRNERCSTLIEENDRCPIRDSQDDRHNQRNIMYQYHYSLLTDTSENCKLVTNCSREKAEDLGDKARWRKVFKLVSPSQCLWRDHFIFLILATLLCGCYAANPNQCAVGLKTPGRTWPQGDIVLEYGQSLTILCMLNKTFIDGYFPGKNASDLVFFRNKKEMEPEYISILNETTISLYVEKPPPAEDMYYCKLRLNSKEKLHEAVCLNKVVIGFKPQEPQNFSCVSYNWESMKCSWVPVQNYITTRFSLVFKLPGRAGGRKLYPCPKETQTANTCLWDTSTNPIYRQPYEYYTFILNVENVLGSINVSNRVHHYAHVIPAKPANLTVINKTSDSALLHWSVPFPMGHFPPGLHHRVTYQNKWDRLKAWQIINITSDIHLHKRYFNLTGLRYANTAYDVRVFLKSALAIGEDKWSKFSVITFRTSPKLPGLSPRIDIGSFELVENNGNRDVFLYWQAIPPYLENGENFKYQISHVEENGRKVDLSPIEITRTYAKFKEIRFNNYRFEIVTANEVGANKKGAMIFVPSQNEIPHEPIAFTKIAFEGGLYELSWKPPNINADITNYTIFWCEDHRDRPYQCAGYLDWVHVHRNTTVYNMTVPDPLKVYQFAISANTERASSGMVWASCTVIHSKVVGKMKSVWINRIGSSFIEVGWKLECSDRIGIVEGFNIYYCPIMSPYNLNCKGPKMNTTIKGDPHTIHGLVTGLKPYTTYMLAVAVLTKTGEGLHSDPLYNTTMEASPASPPQDVQIMNVTNSTMYITWKRPDAMNGVLRYYEVYYNSSSREVEEADYVTLENLKAHEYYNISVAACTISCSARSPPIYTFTDIGTPGMINVPNIRFMNSSQVSVLWNRPEHPAGPVDYYQIWSNDGEIQNSTKTDTEIPVPDCVTFGRKRLHQFRVRAVNIAGNNTHLKGPWSLPGEGSCYFGGPTLTVIIIIGVIGGFSLIVFLICLTYMFKRMWRRCKDMQDVEVKLPPGLAPNMKLLQKVGEQHTRQLSADSSGCSSGQESVTSSLTSDSHVSTDSGADVDPAPVSPNKLLESPPTWESSSLRQRNVTTSRPAIMMESARWDPYVKVAKSSDPVLADSLSLARSTPNLTDSTGYTASQQTWSSTGYISMPSYEELSSNPSPVPKESLKVGGYSIVGIAPVESVHSKPGDDTDAGNSLKGNLLAISKEDYNPIYPYISLSSLDQKPKPTTMDAFRDLEDLAFAKVSSKSSLEDLAPFSISDKLSPPIPQLSKSYVQTGLLDTTTKPLSTSTLIEPTQSQITKASALVPMSLADTRNLSLVSTLSSSTPLTQSFVNPSTKQQPYVMIASISDVKCTTAIGSHTLKSQQTQPSQKPYVPVSSNTSESIGKPYVSAPTVFQMLQQQQHHHHHHHHHQQQQQQQQQIEKTEEENISDLDDREIEDVTLPSDSSYPFCWEEGQPELGESLVAGLENLQVPVSKQSSGYVTIAENPKLESQQTYMKISSPYVQHQRVEKGVPQPSLPESQSADEQYSKVTVVPTTIQ